MLDTTKIHQVPIADINDSDRSRSDLGDIAGLAESISDFTEALPTTCGLIHPILLRGDNQLVAGGRRLEAHRQLNRETIAAVFVEELTDTQLKQLELEENVARFGMSWQERCHNVYEIHQHNERDAIKNGDRWLQKHTGDLLGYTQSHISNLIIVARELIAKDPDILNAPDLVGALKILLGRKEDEAQRRLMQISATATPVNMGSIEILDLEGPQDYIEPHPTDSAPTEKITFDLSKLFFHADCLSILPTFPPDVFDHIVTDPPYAIDMANLSQSQNLERVRDEHDVEENLSLLERFLPEAFRVLKPSGYLVFWYDNYHNEKLIHWATKAGFKVQRWPLVWCKTHRCKNSVPQFNWTKSTEFALVCRKSPSATLVEPALTNFFLADGSVERELYDNPFAKPADAWNFILKQIAITGQHILDPFAGEMSCPRACINRGLKFTAIELNDQHLNKGITTICDLIQETTGNAAQFINAPSTL